MPSYCHKFFQQSLSQNWFPKSDVSLWNDILSLWKLLALQKKAIRYIISNNSILHEKIYPDSVTKIPNLSTIIYFEKFEHKKFRWYVLPWRVSSETVIFISIPSKQRHELNVNIFWLFLTILRYASTHNILRLIQTITMDHSLHLICVRKSRQGRENLDG